MFGNLQRFQFRELQLYTSNFTSKYKKLPVIFGSGTSVCFTFCFNFISYTIFFLQGYLLQFLLYGQRPLKTIARISGDVYIPRGVSAPVLDNDILWEFQPKKVGDLRYLFFTTLYKLEFFTGFIACYVERATSVETIATISKVNIVKRRMEAAYETLQGSVFEDVKCKDVVEDERIRLELEEIVKLFTHGEIYRRRGVKI
ncbi:V-type proton ATPase catalytic subunit A [Artemisia annua]|uniref:V-type proton ATPase catalytic subunit A n=1 Tax=Artemisia annua TaxID=35608 RepID=A0A2U1MK34_ARTAN|nr:V-type proton ATPase catalytic subunit A [Artemisia annua]